jgi:peptide/nickel transport system permease protein
LIDRAFTATALFFYSIPVFVLGLTLLYVFFYQLTIHGVKWFPATGYMGVTSNPAEWARHLLLPWLTLALISAAAYTRLSRTSMLEVLGEDYIRTARSKGLSEGRVIVRHALRSALTPVVTQFGIDFATVLGGAILTESVFGLPGLGRESVQAITNQDLPIIIGIVVVAAAAVILANILVDMMYAVLDPRVRLH